MMGPETMVIGKISLLSLGEVALDRNDCNTEKLARYCSPLYPYGFDTNRFN